MEGCKIMRLGRWGLTPAMENKTCDGFLITWPTIEKKINTINVGKRVFKLKE